MYEIEKFGGKGMKKILKSNLDRSAQQDQAERQNFEKENIDLMEKYKRQPQPKVKNILYPQGKKIK